MQRDTTIERVSILMRQDNIHDEDSTPYPVALKIEGQIHDWPHPDVTQEEGGYLLVNGRRFLFERRGASRRYGSLGLGSERLSIYRYPRGWRILTERKTDTGLALCPVDKWPMEDRQKAWELASRDITSILARFNEARKSILVWQDGEGFSEPVAELDGRNHERAEAVRALLAEEWFPWDREEPESNDEAEDARLESSAPEAPPQEEPSNPKSTTNGSIGQLLRFKDVTAIRPVWGEPDSTDLDLRHGAVTIRIDVPHSEVEAGAQVIGWQEPISGSGYWMRP